MRAVARGSVSRALRLIPTDTTGQMSENQNGPKAKKGVETAFGLLARAVGQDRENARSCPGLMSGTGDTTRDRGLITTTRETTSKGKDKKPLLLGKVF